MAQQIIIGDNNWQEFVGDGESVVIDGHRRYFGFKPTAGRMRVAPFMTLEKAGVPLIPESDWASRAQKMLDDKADLKSLCYHLEPLDQNGRGQCHLYGNCSAMRGLSVRQGGVLRCPSAQSLAYAVWGGRSWGNSGADPASSFEALLEQGAARSEIWPMDGDGQSSRFATPEAEADRANLKLLVGVELGIDNDMWKETVSCLLQGIPVSVAFGWWNHHVCGYSYLPNGNLVILNSWGDWSDNGFGELSGSKKYPDQAFAFIRMAQSV